MKRKLVILFAFLGVLLVSFSSCRMRYAQVPSYKKMHSPQKTRRHYGARKSIWPRKAMWGKKHYGPRPHGSRGRYH